MFGGQSELGADFTLWWPRTTHSPQFNLLRALIFILFLLVTSRTPPGLSASFVVRSRHLLFSSSPPLYPGLSPARLCIALGLMCLQPALPFPVTFLDSSRPRTPYHAAELEEEPGLAMISDLSSSRPSFGELTKYQSLPFLFLRDRSR